MWWGRLVWLGAAMGLSCQPARNADMPPTAEAGEKKPGVRSPQQGQAAEAVNSSAPELARPAPLSPATSFGSASDLDMSRHTEQLLLGSEGSAELRTPSRSALSGRVVMVAHGAGGHARWHCDFWQARIPPDWLLLCVQGRPMYRGADSFYFPQHHFLLDLITRSVKALETRLGATISGRGNIFIGYSQGATMGALVLPEMAPRFPFALLVEGGYRQWPMFQAKRYATRGGLGLFFACGTRSCAGHARRAVRIAEQTGLKADHSWARGAGHRPDGDVGAAAYRGLMRLAAWEAQQP